MSLHFLHRLFSSFLEVVECEVLGVGRDIWRYRKVIIYRFGSTFQIPHSIFSQTKVVHSRVRELRATAESITLHYVGLFKLGAFLVICLDL